MPKSTLTLLGCRERQIKRRHPHPAARAPQHRPVTRIEPREHRAQLRAVDITGQTELGAARPHPHPARLTGTDVVLLRALQALDRIDATLLHIEVVVSLAGPELADGKHHPSGR
jgi:hypothetical protein